MAELPDISRGDSMIEHIKEIAPFVAVIVASIAGWWAWRTSLLKALSERVAHLEGKLDAIAAAHGAAQMRVAELTAENITLRAACSDKDEQIDKWQARYKARRERQISNPGIAEDSEADALDDLAADRSDTSGLIAVPPGGMPK
jgi:hypothetical protein